jgi:hypothetical protein
MIQIDVSGRSQAHRPDATSPSRNEFIGLSCPYRAAPAANCRGHERGDLPPTVACGDVTQVQRALFADVQS